MADAGRLLAVNSLFVLAGFGILRLIRFPIRDRLPSALGIAPMTGTAVCGILLAESATFGIDIGIPVLVVLAVAVFVLGEAAARRRPTARAYRNAGWPTGLLVAEAVGLVCLGVLAVSIARVFVITPLNSWDGWAIWAARAHTLLVDGDAWNPQFLDSAYASQHAEYPILFPSLEAVSLSGIGRFDAILLHSQPALLLAYFGLAVWGSLRAVVSPLLAVLTAVAVMGLQPLVVNFSWNYADGPLAAFVALGLLGLGIWILMEEPTFLRLGSLFLAAACLTKNEGLLFAVAAVFAMLIGMAIAGRKVIDREVGTSVLLIFLPYLPWRIYLSVNGLNDRGDYSIASLVDISYLSAQSSRVPPAAEGLITALAGSWTLALATVAMMILAAMVSGQYAILAFTAVWSLASLAGLTAIYWISNVDLSWLLKTSADRVTITIAVSLTTLAPLLAMAAWAKSAGGEQASRALSILGLVIGRLPSRDAPDAT